MKYIDILCNFKCIPLTVNEISSLEYSYYTWGKGEHIIKLQFNKQHVLSNLFSACSINPYLQNFNSLFLVPDKTDGLHLYCKNIPKLGSDSPETDITFNLETSRILFKRAAHLKVTWS